MTFVEILPSIQALPRADRVRLMQYLATELAREEGVTSELEAIFPVWTPFNSGDAAQVLVQCLRDCETRSCP